MKKFVVTLCVMAYSGLASADNICSEFKFSSKAGLKLTDAGAKVEIETYLANVAADFKEITSIYNCFVASDKKDKAINEILLAQAAAISLSSSITKAMATLITNSSPQISATMKARTKKPLSELEAYKGSVDQIYINLAKLASGLNAQKESISKATIAEQNKKYSDVYK